MTKEEIEEKLRILRENLKKERAVLVTFGDKKFMLNKGLAGLAEFIDKDHFNGMNLIVKTKGIPYYYVEGVRSVDMDEKSYCIEGSPQFDIEIKEIEYFENSKDGELYSSLQEELRQHGQKIKREQNENETSSN